MRYLIIVVLLMGCQPRDDRAATNGADGVDHSQPAPAVGLRLSCGTGDRPTLTGAGLGDLQIGRPAAQLPARCVVLSDTITPGSEAFPERVMTILLTPSDTVRATIENDSLWRVEIASAGIRTIDSLGVGSSLSALMRSPNARAGGFEGEGQLFVFVEQHCGLSFRIDLELDADQHRAEWSSADLSALNGGARVDQILVVGCKVAEAARKPAAS